MLRLQKLFQQACGQSLLQRRPPVAAYIPLHKMTGVVFIRLWQLCKSIENIEEERKNIEKDLVNVWIYYNNLKYSGLDMDKLEFISKIQGAI